MSFQGKPKFRHPSIPTNALGFTRRDYEGSMSTLCAGCGHNSITAAIMHACFELAVPPHRVAKLSGIGCSSKTPTYMLGQSHGFNSVHGRMPSVLTGAYLANRDLIYLGVSGDGDTASIGLGQFCHVMRRGVRMVYIVENNGVYGLTKGQFSATADRGSKSKKGARAADEPIDLAASPSSSARLSSRAVSPATRGSSCRSSRPPSSIAARPSSTSSRPASRSTITRARPRATTTCASTTSRVNALDFITGHEPIEIDYAEGAAQAVTLHDGTTIHLRKLDAEHNFSDRAEALTMLEGCRKTGEIPTGLLYLDEDVDELHDTLGTATRPLNEMSEAELCPGPKALDGDQPVAEVAFSRFFRGRRARAIMTPEKICISRA